MDHTKNKAPPLEAYQQNRQEISVFNTGGKENE